MEHVIQFHESGEDRTGWECSCGRGGSAASHKVEEHAERHVPEGEHFKYRYGGK